jgi:protein-arginine kinase activator protein McsA
MAHITDVQLLTEAANRFQHGVVFGLYAESDICATCGEQTATHDLGHTDPVCVLCAQSALAYGHLHTPEAFETDDEVIGECDNDDCNRPALRVTPNGKRQYCAECYATAEAEGVLDL